MVDRTPVSQLSCVLNPVGAEPLINNDQTIIFILHHEYDRGTSRNTA